MWMERLRRAVASPWATGVVGIAMVGSATYELLEPWIGASLGLGAEHGVFLLGLVHVAKAGVEGIEGAKKVEEAIEEGAGSDTPPRGGDADSVDLRPRRNAHGGHP